MIEFYDPKKGKYDLGIKGAFWKVVELVEVRGAVFAYNGVAEIGVKRGDDAPCTFTLRVNELDWRAFKNLVERYQGEREKFLKSDVKARIVMALGIAGVRTGAAGRIASHYRSDNFWDEAPF